MVQMFFNLIRISSQWASWPFLWFQGSVGKGMEITDNLRIEEKIKIWYSQKDVFDLQFPQYNKFIEYTKDRDDKDGVLIAGTYLQYFLNNPKNIRFDGGLSWFWEQWSDENTCKMYQRLRSENLKYLVIDPNIATVVMWEGNESLFHRFFAKIDSINGKIVPDYSDSQKFAEIIVDMLTNPDSLNEISLESRPSVDGISSKFTKSVWDEIIKKVYR